MLRRSIKIFIILFGIASVGIGANAIINRQYEYVPGDFGQGLKLNKVLFEGDSSTFNNKSENSNDDSQLWQKDDDADNKDKIENDNDSKYLFENKVKDKDGKDLVINDTTNSNNNSNFAGNNTNSNDGSYDLTDDKNKADVIIGGNVNNPNIKEDDIPVSKKDILDYYPEVKPKPFFPGSNVITPGFNEDTISKWDQSDVIVYIGESTDTSTSIYVGQKILSAKNLFYYLDAFVYKDGDDNKLYCWSFDDYDKYIRINGVSFDGGTTYIKEYPLTIPKAAYDNGILFDVSYRLSLNNEWQNFKDEIKYSFISLNRVIILSRPLKEGENTIDPNIVIDDICNLNDVVNLYTEFYYSNVEGFSDNKENYILSGFEEDGEKVDWLFYPTEGRHVLEPSTIVVVPTGYKIDRKGYWIQNPIYGEKYCTLQTLTGYDNSVEKTFFEIPEYVQAIDFSETETIKIDNLYVSEDIIYIAPDNLDVKNSFNVDSKNNYYNSDENGVLYNKSKTDILDVPSSLEKLNIGNDINSVYIPENNNLKTIDLGDNVLKNLNSKNLNSDTKFYINENKVVELFNSKIDYLDSMEIYSKDNKYYLNDSTIIKENQSSNQKYLYKVLDNLSSYILPSSSKGYEIEDYAFDTKNLTQIIMPLDGTYDILSGYKGNNKLKIICINNEQSNAIENIENFVLSTKLESDDGFGYCKNNEELLLLTAPDDISYFDGTIEIDGNVVVPKIIGPSTFKDNKNLKWVNLNEDVKEIDADVFNGCLNLEGVVINSKDEITIGNNAFENLDSLRFIASNAKNANFLDGYAPNVDNFYIPIINNGYDGDKFICFSKESEINSYELVDIGETAKALYGTNDDNQWLLIKSGLNMDNYLNLPNSTIELFANSFEGVNGIFEINWNDLGNLKFVDSYAFYDSKLSGNVVSETIKTVGVSAFGNTNIESIYLKHEDVSLDQFAFSGSSLLQEATFAKGVEIYTGSFYECEQLSKITFEGMPSKLLVVYAGYGFDFDSSRNDDGIIVCIDDELKECFLEENLYIFAGYADDPYQGTALEQLYYYIWDELFFKNWEEPSDEDVQQKCIEILFESENKIRRLLQMDEVKELTYMPDFSIVIW